MRRRRRKRAAPPAVARSGPVRLRPLADVLALPRRSPIYPELARALAAADALHVLTTDLEPVPVRPTATMSQAGAYRSRVGDPVDLRVSRSHGRVPLSFLHELGHFVDHQHDWKLGPALRRVAGKAPSRAPAHASAHHRRYFDSAREVWARSYAQVVLARSSDVLLEEQLLALLDRDDAFVWPPEAFAPLAAGVEAVLAELGLLRALAVAA
jgi:hypothetical protein